MVLSPQVSSFPFLNARWLLARVGFFLHVLLAASCCCLEYFSSLLCTRPSLGCTVVFFLLQLLQNLLDLFVLLYAICGFSGAESAGLLWSKAMQAALSPGASILN